MAPYNHTRGDSALTPCPICRAIAAGFVLESELDRPGYSLLRAVFVLHPGVVADILREEILQVVGAAVAAVQQPSVTVAAVEQLAARLCCPHCGTSAVQPNPRCHLHGLTLYHVETQLDSDSWKVREKHDGDALTVDDLCRVEQAEEIVLHDVYDVLDRLRTEVRQMPGAAYASGADYALRLLRERLELHHKRFVG
jgi:hypothetical protein